MRAVYSLDPSVSETRASLGTTSATIFDAAIGDDHIEHRVEVVSTLGHVVDSVIFNWLSRRRDASWVRSELETAVRALMRGAGPIEEAPEPRRRVRGRRQETL